MQRRFAFVWVEIVVGLTNGFYEEVLSWVVVAWLYVNSHSHPCDQGKLQF
jgi:hypothetical protein